MEKIPENKAEQESAISDEYCLEAMKTGNFEVVGAWYAEREKIADLDPTPQGRFNLTLRLAKLQTDAGLIDYAAETLDAAYVDAYQRGDDEAAAQLKDLLDQLEK